MTTQAVSADFYALLGVAPNATPEAIRRAYAPLAQAAMNAENRERFNLLHEAFETLKDTDRRAQYDAERANPAIARTQMANATPLGGAESMALTPFRPSAADEGKTAHVGTIPAGGLNACPYNEAPCASDEGFCVKCGFLIGSPLGQVLTPLPLPTLRDTGGRLFPLQMGDNIVGRESADVLLPDKSISRRHARIQVEAGNVVGLEDTGSTNGTKHKGQPVQNAMVSLKDGDTVQFGTIALTIIIPQAAGGRLALPSAAVEKPKVAGIIPAAQNPHVTASAKAMVAVPQAKARLEGKSGTFAIAKSTTTFGRKSSNDVVLSGDSFVSGSHAQIERDATTFTVTDLGSTNGTRLNGRKLNAGSRETLRSGDTVLFGQTEFTFHIG